MNRNIYVLSYIASILISAVIGYFTKSTWILLLCLFALRFAVNFYYGHKLQVNITPKIFSSIFSSFGFLFLMGYDKKVMGAWEIFLLGIKVYKKNFWYLLSYILIIVLINAILGLLFGSLFSLINSLLSGVINIIVHTITFALFFGITMVFNIIIFLATIMGVKESYLEKSDFKNIIPNIKTSYKYFWRFVGAAILKTIVANGPVIVGILGFIIVSLSVIWNAIGAKSLTTSLMKPNAFTIITGTIIIYGIFHSFYFLIRLLFYVYGILFENKEAKESLYYSMEVSKNKWWQILWRVFIPAWLVALVSVLVIFSTQYILPSQSVVTIVAYIIQIVLWPLTFMFPYLLFENLKSNGVITNNSATIKRVVTKKE